MLPVRYPIHKNVTQLSICVTAFICYSNPIRSSAYAASTDSEPYNGKTYWEVGKLIVEHEQGGQDKAAYGQQQLKQISKQLKTEFGKGFNEQNLRRIRAFHQAYPIWTAVRSELSWTHYRVQLQIENHTARA